MNITTTSAALSGTSTQSTTAKKSELDMNQFIRLLTVQLANQNPLEPMNDRDFFAQMAQLGQVQGLDRLQDASELQQAQSLMGKRVTAFRSMTEGENGTAQVVEGIVKRMTVKNGEYYLGIQQQDGGMVEVKMSGLQSISPADDVTEASHLIGKHVAGMGYRENDELRKEVDAVGKVIGVSRVDGRTVLQVQTENGNIVVPLTNLTHVTE